MGTQELALGILQKMSENWFLIVSVCVCWYTHATVCVVRGQLHCSSSPSTWLDTGSLLVLHAMSQVSWCLMLPGNLHSSFYHSSTRPWPLALCGYWGFKQRPSCSHGKCLTHWAICPGLVFISELGPSVPGCHWTHLGAPPYTLRSWDYRPAFLGSHSRLPECWISTVNWTSNVNFFVNSKELLSVLMGSTGLL